MNTREPHIALSIKDLSIGYASKKERIAISSKIDFDLNQGELIAIVGVNGIGKSTLLRTLGNVQPKLSGSIDVKGKSLESYRSYELATEISLVLTEPIASKNLTVLELICLGRQPYTNWLGSLSQTDKEKITAAIEMVRLEELQHKKCYELSDGQLQKVMIARAVAQDTSIMLLDEPTTHLDLYHKAQILKLLQQIAHTTNKTIVYTTHEIELGLQLADKMLLMKKGETSFGTPKQLIENGEFESMFPTDTITFDPKTASFKINK
ncbi:MAG: ABC transporter ATP-binding protein [Flavobacteriaceae bacterium]|nr:MAG: ABC transporter ATP-binding protein [Flavobacteriaceae bacterium]